MKNPLSDMGWGFARRVLLPHWFEIASGIVVGASLVLIFGRKLVAG